MDVRYTRRRSPVLLLSPQDVKSRKFSLWRSELTRKIAKFLRQAHQPLGDFLASKATDQRDLCAPQNLGSKASFALRLNDTPEFQSSMNTSMQCQVVVYNRRVQNHLIQ
jgi:hypothetical protein